MSAIVIAFPAGHERVAPAAAVPRLSRQERWIRPWWWPRRRLSAWLLRHAYARQDRRNAATVHALRPGGGVCYA